MNKIRKSIDEVSTTADKFLVDGEIKTILADDSGVIVEGTGNDADFLNEISKNCFYEIELIKQGDNYLINDTNLEGIKEFGNFNLKFLATFTNSNAVPNPTIIMNEVTFITTDVEIGKIKVGEKYLIFVDHRSAKYSLEILSQRDKTDKGGYTRTSKNIIEEVMGGEYRDILNDTNTKIVGKIYYDTATKRNFLCKTQNNLNYANLDYYDDITNKELNSKLKNLIANFNQTDILDTDISGLVIKRKNGIVSLSYKGNHTGTSNNIIYKLPAGYRPLVDIRVSIFPTSTFSLNLIVYTNGSIALDCDNGGPTAGVQGGISFACDQFI